MLETELLYEMNVLGKSRHMQFITFEHRMTLAPGATR